MGTPRRAFPSSKKTPKNFWARANFLYLVVGVIFLRAAGEENLRYGLPCPSKTLLGDRFGPKNLHRNSLSPASPLAEAKTANHNTFLGLPQLPPRMGFKCVIEPPLRSYFRTHPAPFHPKTPPPHLEANSARNFSVPEL